MDQDAIHPLLVVAFNGKVFGLERATGTVTWRVEVEPNGEVVELLIDDTTVIACTKSYLAFIDYASGELRNLLKRRDEGVGQRPVMIFDNDCLFVASSGFACSYSLDGQLLWDQKFTGERFGETALGFPFDVRQADYVRR